MNSRDLILVLSAIAALALGLWQPLALLVALATLAAATLLLFVVLAVADAVAIGRAGRALGYGCRSSRKAWQRFPG